MNIRSNGGSSGGRRELSQLPFVRRSQSPKMLSDADAPKLRNPILIAAFEGWNDAGEAASYAAGYLARQGYQRREAVEYTGSLVSVRADHEVP